jgi:hypothetical protein
LTLRRRPFSGLLAAATMLSAFAAPAVRAVEPDWRDYARLLERHVHAQASGHAPTSRVNYSGLRLDPLFDRVAAQLASFRPEMLSSRDEKLAFYANAYNVLAIKVVRDHWPVSSIRDAGSLLRPVWKKPAGIVGGRSVTLDEIEHEILRPLGEPRVHFAIVCASGSCPDLRGEPYEAARLDAQLDDQARRFLHHPDKGLRVEAGRIRVSRLFAWFAADFESGGGIETFIRRYRGGLPELPIRADLDYDWSLNGS